MQIWILLQDNKLNQPMGWFAIVKKFTNIAMFVWKLEFGIWFGRNLAERIRRSTARLRKFLIKM